MNTTFSNDVIKWSPKVVVFFLVFLCPPASSGSLVL